MHWYLKASQTFSISCPKFIYFSPDRYYLFNVAVQRWGRERELIQQPVRGLTNLLYRINNKQKQKQKHEHFYLDCFNVFLLSEHRLFDTVAQKTLLQFNHHWFNFLFSLFLGKKWLRGKIGVRLRIKHFPL